MAAGTAHRSLTRPGDAARPARAFGTFSRPGLRPGCGRSPGGWPQPLGAPAPGGDAHAQPQVEPDVALLIPLPSSAPRTTVGSWFLIFYTDVALITPATAATIMLVACILDGVQDLGLGYLAERTRSRWGAASVPTSSSTRPCSPSPLSSPSHRPAPGPPPRSGTRASPTWCCAFSTAFSTPWSTFPTGP
ncbi:MFS transporter [Actinomyces lilanjuaniae]|uniref:MFS transporter n=1 Tax=Actinomyces lilanjuaniae TaxID=2321394 RepID=UPI003C12C62F